MPDTEWQKEEDKRFIKNSIIVRGIAESFGLRMLGFNPRWSFETRDGYYEISDDFMGKTAAALGYLWDFNNDILEDIKSLEEWVKQCHPRLRDSGNLYKQIKSKVVGEDGVILGLENLRKHDEKSLHESEKRLRDLKKVVEIRNNIIHKGCVK